MTRDGRPSRIKDLRLFGAEAKRPGISEATAFGRRLAWWLNGQEFTIGHEPALYVTFDPALPQGSVEPKPQRFTPDDWWFREVSVGVPDDFPGDDDASVATAGIIAALQMLRPDCTGLIERAAQTVATEGEACRFLLRSKEGAKDTLEISTTIGVWPGPSLLYAGMTGKATGAYREAPPVELRFYDDGVLLAGKVKVVRRGVDLVARTSTPARLVADSHGGGVSWHVDSFTEAQRPVLSGLLKFR